MLSKTKWQSVSVSHLGLCMFYPNDHGTILASGWLQKEHSVVRVRDIDEIMQAKGVLWVTELRT